MFILLESLHPSWFPDWPCGNPPAGCGCCGCPGAPESPESSRGWRRWIGGGGGGGGGGGLALPFSSSLASDDDECDAVRALAMRRRCS